METAERSALIRRKVEDGSLPTKPCATLWGGTGTGERCAACGASIRAPEIEFECHGEEGLVVRLCRPCFIIWDSLVAGRR